MKELTERGARGNQNGKKKDPVKKRPPWEQRVTSGWSKRASQVSKEESGPDTLLSRVEKSQRP